MRRRAFLAVSGAVVTVGVAGCTGDDGGDDDGTPTATATDTPGDGSTPTDAPTETPGDDETPTETPDGNGDGPAFGEWIQGGDSFAIEMVSESPETDGEVTMQGRFHGGNSYWSMEFQGQTIESYTVDGDDYLVMGGTCFLNPGDQQQPYDPEDDYDPGGWDDDVEEYSGLTPDGTATIDGEEMYVYRLSDAGVDQITYYVSVESGYLRRVEFPGGHIDYHSWGEVDPIEAPDMECQSF